MWIFKILFLNILIYLCYNFKWQKQYNNYNNPPVRMCISIYTYSQTHTYIHTHLEKILKGSGCLVWWHYGQLFCKCYPSSEEAVEPLDSK